MTYQCPATRTRLANEAAAADPTIRRAPHSWRPVLGATLIRSKARPGTYRLRNGSLVRCRIDAWAPVTGRVLSPVHPDEAPALEALSKGAQQ